MNDRRSESDAVVRRHILSCRRQFEHPDMSDLYHQFFGVVDSALKQHGVSASYIVSYSKQRHTENLAHRGNNYIVYDQYMGQTVSMFNRMFFEEKDPHCVIGYAHKLIGETLQTQDRFAEALVCADIYHDFKEELKTDHTKDNERALFTLVQEFFILAHEVSHILIDSSEKLRSTATKNIEEYLVERNEKHVAISKMDLVKRDSLYPYDYLKKWANPAEIEFAMRHQGSTEQTEFEKKISQMLCDDNSLKEELFCDHHATSLTCIVMTEYYGLSLKEVLRAIYLCLYHLRAIRSLEHATMRFIDPSPETSDQSEKLHYGMDDESLRHMVRSQYGLSRCSELYYYHSAVDYQPIYPNRQVKELVLAPQEFHLMLLDIQQQYYKIILDPWNGCIGHALEDRGLHREVKKQVAENKPIKRILETMAGNRYLSVFAKDIMLDSLFGSTKSSSKELEVISF